MWKNFDDMYRQVGEAAANENVDLLVGLKWFWAMIAVIRKEALKE